MSLRHLKRLEQLSITTPAEGDEDDTVDEVIEKPVKKSLFQMLAEEDEQPSIDEADSANSEQSPKKSSAPLQNEMPGPATKKKKNKNKAKRKSGKGDQVADDIEKELRYIEDETQAPISKVNTETQPEDEFTIQAVLRVELKNLKSDNEVYRRFGVKSLNAGKSGKIGNRSIFIGDTSRYHAELHGRKIGGITMKPVSKPNYFEFEFSPEYWNTQADFKFFVEHSMVDYLQQILQERGDHIDLLIQFSNIFREDSDVPKAAKLIEQALYILEKAFHSQFSVLSGNCRLDYASKPNRSLFIVLFLYAYHISLRGCPRTALELSKVILSLDPDCDPLAILLIIDYYALRAEQFKWLIKFFDVFQLEGRNLDKLPNLAYSVALANFHAQNFERADEMLQTALLHYPNVAKAIADKNSIMMDKATAAVFDKLYPDNIEVDLYAERCAYLFKEPEVMLWMEKNCAAIVASGAKPNTVEAPKRLTRNVLRHIPLSHVPGIRLKPKHLPNISETVYEYDPFPPTKSYGDLTPSRDWVVEGDDDTLPDATLNNFLNSLNPNWRGDDGEQNVGANLRRGVGNLLEAVADLMGNIMEQQHGQQEAAAIRGAEAAAADAQRGARNRNEEEEEEEDGEGEGEGEARQ